jgi:hypothetical protein
MQTLILLSPVTLGKEGEKMNEKYQSIIRHPYITRQGKMFLLIDNATVDHINALMCLLDIAENLCVCNDFLFKKLLPVFRECYSMVGDADKEIEFIKSQRKGQVKHHDESNH